uniref:Uncharacterized protein n=1 Tax=Arundo donax TaxID=35708 RepID=A0A0A9AD73_ARUDO
MTPQQNQPMTKTKKVRPNKTKKVLETSKVLAAQQAEGHAAE